MAPNHDSVNQLETSAPASAKAKAKANPGSGQPSRDEDEFIDIHPEDIEMQEGDSAATAPPLKTSIDSLDLQRIGQTQKADHDEEEDSEDDHDIMANHPLLGMLTGRLGQRRRGSSHKWDQLHPENQALSVSNVDECSALEDEAFPVESRASREKFEYRLTRCPELSLGLFTQPTKAERKELSAPAERQLIGHIISTKTAAPSVTEAAMGMPTGWRTQRTSPTLSNDKELLGHQDTGATICVHSLAVAPRFQKMGLGTVLMKSYIQRMKDAKIADRIALIAHDHLVPFYSSLGFENMGPSPITSYGGNWNNMILEFSHEDED